MMELTFSAFLHGYYEDQGYGPGAIRIGQQASF